MEITIALLRLLGLMHPQRSPPTSAQAHLILQGSAFPPIGVNIDLLMNISAAANVTITFDVFKLPDSIQNSSDKTLSLLYLFYNSGYDCVVTATQLNAYRSGYMNFLNAYQPFGVLDPAALASQ